VTLGVAKAAELIYGSGTRLREILPGVFFPAEAEPMSADEAAIEKEIQQKGLNAPRLNPAAIDATIVGEAYHVFPGTTLTVCCLTLRNGFQVIGESAAASPANFDEAICRKIAWERAREKIWSLEGYLLRERLWLAASTGEKTA
jgi:hypothetical protein